MNDIFAAVSYKFNPYARPNYSLTSWIPITSVMDLLHSANSYFKLFYFFGFSPLLHHDVIGHQKIRSHYLHKVPSVILLVLSLLLSSYSGWLIYNPSGRPYKPAERIISNLFLVCDIIKNCAIFVQSICFGYTFIDLLFCFKDLSQYFKQFAHWDINYNDFRKMYSKPFLFMVITYLNSYWIFLLDLLVSQNYEPIGFVYKCWQAVTTFAYTHIVFYIVLLRFHLMQLNSIIKKETTDQQFYTNASDCSRMKADILLQKKIKNYKVIYYRLWRISQKINDVFGWMMGSLLLQSFSDGTFGLYWLYYIFREEDNQFWYLRK